MNFLIQLIYELSHYLPYIVRKLPSMVLLDIRVKELEFRGTVSFAVGNARVWVSKQVMNLGLKTHSPLQLLVKWPISVHTIPIILKS